MASYESLKKTYPILPEKQVMLEAFNISSLDDTSLGNLSEDIIDRYDETMGIMRCALNPEASVTGMHEHASISPEERMVLYSLFKQVIHLKRSVQLARLAGCHSMLAGEIAKSVPTWARVREELFPLFQLITDSWLKDAPEDAAEDSKHQDYVQ
jgi:hypothetical protein